MLHETKRRPGLLAPTIAALLASISLGPQAVAGEVPANGWVVWTSFRDGGRPETFRCRADGSEVTQLTKTGSTSPFWSPDGRWIVYRDTGEQSHLMRPDGSNDHLIAGANLGWMHDNAGLLMLLGDDAYVLDPDTGDKTPLFKRSEFTEFANTLTHFHSMTHDRRYVLMGTGLYDYGFTGANGTFKQGYTVVLVDMLDKRKIYMMGLGCWAFTPPAGDMVYHIRGDGPTWPDIYHMNLADLLTRSSYEAEVSYPDPDWGHEYQPQISNDNQWMVYMTSQGCHWDYGCNNELFIHKLGSPSTSRTQVTYHDSFDGLPSIYVGTPWTATSPARLVLSPNKITFFARNGAVPEARTVIAKSSAADNPAVDSVTVSTSASWFDATVLGNKITVSPRPGQVWQGRCVGTVSVTVPGLEGSPGLIEVVLDADSSFPVAPVSTVQLDAGVIDADGTVIDSHGTVIDASLASFDAGMDLARDLPPCDAYLPAVDGGPTIVVTPPANPRGGGCNCSFARSTERGGAFLLFLLAFLLRRPRRQVEPNSQGD